MKSIYFTLCFLVVSILCDAQKNSDIIFFSGQPYINTDLRFETIMWLYNADSLSIDSLHVLSTRNEIVEKIALYPESKLLTIYKSDFYESYAENNRLVIVNLNDSIGIKEVNIDYSGYGLIASHLIKQPESNYIGLYLFGPNSDGPRVYKGVNLDDFSVVELSLKEFNNPFLVGISGTEIDGGDYIIVYSNEKTGELEIPYIGNRQLRPKLLFEIPEEYRFNAYARQMVAINNDAIFVVIGEKINNKNELGRRELIIYNKNNKNWTSVSVKGNIPRIRSFGEWIVGYVANEKIDGMILPGSDLWKKRTIGLSPSERFRISAPGILYIFNVNSDLYFEINTNQADSEILFVENNVVIYRVYDRIYSVDIIVEEKRIGEPILLLKGERVPDIHWAYIIRQ